MKFLAAIVLCTTGALWAHCAVDTSAAARGVFSADKTIAVFARDVPGDEIGLRTPLLHFANNIIRDLKLSLDLKNPPPRLSPAIIITCGDGLERDGSFSTNAAVNVSTSLANGERQTRIFLPAPGHSDREKLRHAIAKAYFGIWGEVPDWFVSGALALSSREELLKSLDAIQAEWQTGFLPTLGELSEGAGGRTDWSFMVHWMIDAHIQTGILDSLASGETWSGAAIAEELASSGIFSAQEAALDEHLLKIKRSVFNPGSASRRELNAFSSRLWLYPAVFDLEFACGRRKLSFREAVAFRKDPMVRMAALLKMRELPLAAVGRGDELQSAAAAYIEFLKLLATGAREEELSAALDDAEAKLAITNTIEK